jgi:hypothetical protein
MSFSKHIWNMYMGIAWLVLSLPATYAVSLALSGPSSIVEDSGVAFSYSIQSDNPFDGSLSLTPTNAQATPSGISFSASSFTGTHINGTLIITGTNPGSFSLVGTLSNATATLATSAIAGDVNSSAPKVLSSSPSGVLTSSSTILTVRTDEIAICKYGISDAPYSSLANTFTNTNALNHNQTVSGLGEGTHTYYVKCQDPSNHEMNISSVIQFTVDMPPTASIELSDPSPVKAGTLEITLRISESIPSTPVLQYSYDDSGAKKSIALSGSGSTWKGFIIITESDNNKVGSFTFSATDSSGNSGTTITSGGIFIVDTVKPAAPSSLKATVLPHADVRLDWYYDGEDVDIFKIYRSTASGVQYVDFYADTSEEDDDDENNQTRRYTDTGTVDKATYYYRIAAVDKAGNEGPLSDEIYATAVYSIAGSTITAPQPAPQQAEEDVPRVLPPNLVTFVNDQVKKIDKIMLDIDTAYAAVEEITNQETLDLLQELSIKQKMESSKATLQELKARAIELKGHYATKDELESSLAQIDAELRRVELSTVKSASVKSKADVAQTLSKDDIVTAANYVLQNSPLTEEEQQRYIRLNDRNKGAINVDTSIKIIELTYVDNSQKQKSYIRKSISPLEQKALQDVVLLEFIPKAVAASASELTILTPNYEVLEEDPVIKFGFLNFKAEGESIAYTLDKEINIEDMKASKSVVLLSLNELSQPNVGITGLVINPLNFLGLSKTESFFVLAGILTVVILTGYYLIFLDGMQTLSRGARRKFQLARLGAFGHFSRNAPHDVGKLHLSEPEASMVLHELYAHIDAAKKNAAEQLLPALFSLHNRLDSKKQNLSVQEMIHLAHYHADKKNLAQAAELYKRINVLYASLPKETKATVYRECEKLHQKLKEFKA